MATKDLLSRCNTDPAIKRSGLDCYESAQSQVEAPENKMASLSISDSGGSTFGPFERLPIEVKTMIWTSAIHQPKIVEVEAALKVSVGINNQETFEISFALASDHTIESLFVNKQARAITLTFAKSLVLENALNTFLITNLDAIRGTLAHYSLHDLSRATIDMPSGIKHLALNAPQLVDVLNIIYRDLGDRGVDFNLTSAIISLFEELQSLDLVLDSATANSERLQKSKNFIPGCDGLIFERGKTPMNEMRNIAQGMKLYREAGLVKWQMAKAIHAFNRNFRGRIRIAREDKLKKLAIRIVKWELDGKEFV